jgi:RNA polymerase sigma factor (sigma-70 family)
MTTGNPAEESRFEMEILNRFAKEIESLEPIYQVIIALHYYEELDLKKIAAKLNLAESKVSRLHTIAILTIHEQLKELAA